jgi:hypothetical protein
MAEWLLWSALVTLSISLVLVMRTRWGQSRPLQKCAVLSLLVHLVFGCLAMTVRIVAGDGNGSGTGPTVRVRIVEEPIESTALAPTFDDITPTITPPDLLEPPPTPPVEEPAEDTAVDSPVEPELGETELVDDAPETEERVSPKLAVNDMPETTVAPTDVNLEALPQAKSSTPVAVIRRTAAPPVASAAYALRTAPGRLGLIERQGGNARTEEAVQAALEWLVTAQSSDGRWEAARHGAGRELAVLGHNRHGAGRDADTGITALALLAFLGAGHSHIQGDHQAAVRRGLDYLVRSQGSDGNLFGHATLNAQMYCHSMATFALAETQAMTGDKRLEPHVQRAIAYCVRAQHPSTGGWRYQPGDPGDTSQLGWQLMALASARRAGVAVPEKTWSGIELFLRSVRRGTFGGLASYRPDGPATTAMTAEAFYCRLLLSAMGSDSIDERSVAESTGQLLASIPDSDRINLYYWYYATLALHHRQQASEAAAAAWHAWNDALTTTLLGKQVTSGTNAGSWDPDCLWGGYGGRVYTTAVAAMCLEVYYRYAPESRDEAWLANRPREDESGH